MQSAIVAATVPTALDGIVAYMQGDLGVINVRDYPFYAAGDGNSLDTVSVRAAVMSGGGKTIRFPPGVYVVDPITIYADNTTIEGAGPATILRLSPQAGNQSSILIANNRTGVTIKDLTFDGNAINRPETSDFGLSLLGTTNATVSRCIFRNISIGDGMGKGGDGIYLGGTGANPVSTGAVVTWNRFANCGRNGISVVNSVAGVNISENEIDSQNGNNAGIDVEPGSGSVRDFRFNKNRVTGGTNGIVCAAATNATVTDGVIEGNNFSGLTGTAPGAAIRILKASRLTIQGNTLNALAGNGIAVQPTVTGSTDITINGNTITAATGNGAGGAVVLSGAGPTVMVSDISLNGNVIKGATAPNGQQVFLNYVKNYSVQGNTLTGGAGHGILVQLCTDGSLGGNTVTNHAGRGIYLSANTNITLLANTATDDQEVKTQTYGLYVSSGIVGVVANHFAGNRDGDILNLGTLKGWVELPAIS
jgi:parallel beta-helix repeat protein